MRQHGDMTCLSLAESNKKRGTTEQLVRQESHPRRQGRQWAL